MGLADIPKPSLNAIDDVGDEAAQEGPQTSDSEANAQVVDSPSARVETSKAKRGSQPKKSAEPISADADRKDTKSDELRDLARKAYSRDSLHTYKSDPLSRRNKGTPANKKGGGKGQPNMKLRMNYMLEKIKRDYS
ncbi:hypothetical protein VNI00_003427 [Paramarasmius palmivorus]|uniref:rRNA-processing protein FYV7 n=1 Tax=Paramarasmius palmivorus TaxID=297713 RepID=A0AAW0DSS6_9AGAR